MYHIIVNPASRSGKGNKVWRQLEPALLQRQVPYQVYFSEKPGDVAKETRRLSALNQKISHLSPEQHCCLGDIINSFITAVALNEE